MIAMNTLWIGKPLVQCHPWPDSCFTDGAAPASSYDPSSLVDEQLQQESSLRGPMLDSEVQASAAARGQKSPVVVVVSGVIVEAVLHGPSNVFIHMMYVRNRRKHPMMPPHGRRGGGGGGGGGGACVWLACFSCEGQWVAPCEFSRQVRGRCMQRPRKDCSLTKVCCKRKAHGAIAYRCGQEFKEDIVQ